MYKLSKCIHEFIYLGFAAVSKYIDRSSLKKAKEKQKAPASVNRTSKNGQ